MENNNCEDCVHYEKFDSSVGRCVQILTSISHDEADLMEMCVPAVGFCCSEFQRVVEYV